MPVITSNKKILVEAANRMPFVMDTNETRDVDDAFLPSALLQGCKLGTSAGQPEVVVEATKESAPEFNEALEPETPAEDGESSDEMSRKELIADAVKLLIRTGGPDALNAHKKPRVARVSELVGFETNANEIAEVMDQVKAESE